MARCCSPSAASASGRLPPLEVGIAAQRAEPGAGRIDQHPVDLAGEALDPVVALVRDLHRIDVREELRAQPRLERREPVPETSKA
jgi:hypothetical protein